MQFHPVEAAFAGVSGHARVTPDDFENVLVLDRLGDFAKQRIGERRRRPGRQPGKHAAALPPVVVDLGQDRHVFGVDRRRDPAIMGNDPAMKGVNQLLSPKHGQVGQLLHHPFLLGC